MLSTAKFDHFYVFVYVYQTIILVRIFHDYSCLSETLLWRELRLNIVTIRTIPDESYFLYENTIFLNS